MVWEKEEVSNSLSFICLFYLYKWKLFTNMEHQLDNNSLLSLLSVTISVDGVTNYNNILYQWTQCITCVTLLLIL